MNLIVNDIYERAQLILGACSQSKIFGELTNVVEVLANSSTVDPLVGFVDICVDGCVVTLPREVDVPLMVNINGNPAIGRDMGFRFHLNGMGDFGTPCRFQWEDMNLVPTFRPLHAPSKLIAFVQEPEDQGAELWVYGFDPSNQPLRSKEGGTWVNGIRIPTILGYAVPDADSQIVARISRIRKARTVGPIRLASFDSSASTGTQLGVFAFDETDPQYRQIRITPGGKWVRIMFRRSVFRISDIYDVIPIPSQTAILMMLRAMKYYDEKDIALATAYEATARRLLTEAQQAHSPPVGAPLQVNDACGIIDQHDRID